MNTTPAKSLEETCKSIGAKIEPYCHSEPVTRVVPGSDPLRAELVSGQILLVTYDPYKVPEIFATFGNLSDARIVGCICGPLVLLKKI